MADITLCNFSVPITAQMYDETREIITVPLGPLYLASYLEANGYTAKFKDYQTNDFENPLDSRNLLSFFEDSSDILGVSSLSFLLPHLLVTLKKIKKDHPEKTIILGGYGPGGVAEEIIRHFNFVDVVVKGEGEKTLLELVDHLEKGKDLGDVKGTIYKDKGKVRITQQRERVENLDELPFPAYDKIDIHQYTDIGVISSRGCSYACTFCDINPTWQRRFTYRSLENFIDEIKLLYERHGIRKIRIFDNIFPVKNIEKFCDLLRKERLDIGWTCYARVDLMNERLMKKMSEAGCYGIFYGVESGSDEVLRKIGKTFTAKQAERVVLQSKKYIKTVKPSLIFGFPFETLTDSMKTFMLADKLSKQGTELSFSSLCPVPNSKLYNDYKDALLFDLESISGLSYIDYRMPLAEKAEVINYIKKYPRVFPTFYYFPTPSYTAKKKLYDKFCISLSMEEFSSLEPYVFTGRYYILLVERGQYHELNRRNQYIEIELSKSNLQNFYTKIKKLKPKLVLLLFRMKTSDLKVTNGKKIIDFLLKLRKSRIDFRLAHSLPRCIFDLETIQIAKDLNVSTTCKDCLQLFSLKQQTTNLCEFAGDSLRYNAADFNNIRRNFDVFYQESKPAYGSCRDCIFRMRKQCTCHLCINQSPTKSNIYKFNK